MQALQVGDLIWEKEAALDRKPDSRFSQDLLAYILKPVDLAFKESLWTSFPYFDPTLSPPRCSPSSRPKSSLPTCHFPHRLWKSPIPWLPAPPTTTPPFSLTPCGVWPLGIADKAAGEA